MAVEDTGTQIFLAFFGGFCLLCLSEFLLRPRPKLWKPAACFFALAGLWATVFSLLIVLTRRPWCTMCACLAMNFILIMVNNAKYKSMREPFLFQDYDYFLDTLRFPRLFLPFLGIKSFCAATLSCCVAIWGLICEPPVIWGSFTLSFVLSCLSSGILFLWLAYKFQPAIQLDPEKDFLRLGLISFLWIYGLKNRKITYPKPFFPAHACAASSPPYPHLVAMQSESFFDVRKLFAGIKPGLLSNLDTIYKKAFLHGSLNVPAWGANTARTECAFLTGIEPEKLGIHKFNPYQSMLRRWKCPALPGYLRGLGYRTICLHPYYGAFYGRDKIFPALGFDAFMDYKFFNKNEKMGQYISDLSLGQKIVEILQQANTPTFVFAISMENHGPLHLEKTPAPETAASFFDILPPHGCQELAIYLNHIVHTDEMLGQLMKHWEDFSPVSLCFYGDHVPIMPRCYSLLGAPQGEVPYFCWSNRMTGCNKNLDLNVFSLAASWLESLNLYSKQCVH